MVLVQYLRLLLLQYRYGAQPAVAFDVKKRKAVGSFLRTAFTYCINKLDPISTPQVFYTPLAFFF